MQRTISLRANVCGDALGSAARQVATAIRNLGEVSPRVNVTMAGQIIPMVELEENLKRGLAIAVVAIGLLLVANFQSLRLSFAVVSVIPAVLAGVVLALWTTG